MTISMVVRSDSQYIRMMRNPLGDRNYKRLKKITRYCENCGESYHPYIRQQKFCSWKCYAASIAPKPKPCSQCGIQFIPLKPQVQLCSKKCANEALRANRGPKSRFWRGGKYADAHGYIVINISALTPEERILAVEPGRKLSIIREHRLVMAKHLGRILTKREIVHHKNGIRTDNRLENLELWTTAHPVWQRATDMICPHCGKSIVQS